MARAASRLTLVAARDAESAQAFRELGAPRVELGGNLKADLPDPRPLHGGWEPLRLAWAGLPVLVAGNTVEGEEDLLLAVFDRVRARHPGTRLILAPRQPRRFQEVAGILRGRPFRRASEPWPPDPGPWEGTEILLLDTLGELAAAYREGTLALVGGGWSWHGGHNPLEPLRFGLPTLIGPGFANFEDLVVPLRRAGLLEVVPSEQVAERACDLVGRTDARPAQTGPPPAFPEGLAGSLGKTANFLKKCLPRPR
jgi:3-deoxy-D-manno-octulosonic-acid transferase